VGEKEEKLRWIPFEGDCSRVVTVQRIIKNEIETTLGTSAEVKAMETALCFSLAHALNANLSNVVRASVIAYVWSAVTLNVPAAVTEDVYAEVKRRLAANESKLIRISNRDPSARREECLSEGFSDPDVNRIFDHGEDREWWYGIVATPAFSGDVAGADDAEASTDTEEIALGRVEQLAEFIFSMRAGCRQQALLFKEARKRGDLGTFTGPEFRKAFGRVYDTKRGHPPVSGWPLREPYKSRG